MKTTFRIRKVLKTTSRTRQASTYLKCRFSRWFSVWEFFAGFWNVLQTTNWRKALNARFSRRKINEFSFIATHHQLFEIMETNAFVLNELAFLASYLHHFYSCLVCSPFKSVLSLELFFNSYKVSFVFSLPLSSFDPSHIRELLWIWRSL